jgi:hypothetical protein
MLDMDWNYLGWDKNQLLALVNEIMDIGVQ